MLQIPAPHPSATDYMATKKTPSKPVGAYRPPGARGQITPLAFKREDEGGAAFVRDSASSFSSNVNGFGKPRTRTIPGAEPAEKSLPPGAAPGGGVSLTGSAEAAEAQPLSKSAKKNAKKREAKKAAAEASRDGPDALVPEAINSRAKSPNRSPSRQHQRNRSRGGQGQNNASLGTEVPTGPRNGRSRSSSRRNTQSQPNGAPHRPAAQAQKQKPAAVDTATTPPVPVPAETPAIDVSSPTTPGGIVSEKEKKIRGLLKKIRAIDDLKMRHAGGEKLEDTQVKKITSEESVRKELTILGYTG